MGTNGQSCYSMFKFSEYYYLFGEKKPNVIPKLMHWNFLKQGALKFSKNPSNVFLLVY